VSVADYDSEIPELLLIIIVTLQPANPFLGKNASTRRRFSPPEFAA
jgi:hypothetical protein